MKDVIKIIFYIFPIVFFIGIGFSFYDLRFENKKLNEKIIYLENEIEVNSTIISSVSDDLFISVSNEMEDKKKIEEKISIIEESIDPKDFRWAKIKKVREAIKDVSSKKFAIEELTSIASAFVDYSEEYDVDISLALAVARQESNFVSTSVSSAGAQGIMQVLPSTAKDIKQIFDIKYYTPFKPSHNVRLGVAYLSRMLYLFDGNESFSIRAYNCGPTCVEKVESGKWIGYPQETIDYLDGVLKWKEQFKKRGL